ncbi:MAG: hypothetical protein NC084_04610 [Bacteroides sp.]|nr:hypothetical protein [Eubacterium sp.]MCM1418675.1 hypothetical protein [Roseburia sp.]MCM1461979.1 hypothetical protein [Bacteroides sp.]
MKIKNLFKKATAVLLAGIMATSAGTATFAESEIATSLESTYQERSCLMKEAPSLIYAAGIEDTSSCQMSNIFSIYDENGNDTGRNISFIIQENKIVGDIVFAFDENGNFSASSGLQDYPDVCEAFLSGKKVSFCSYGDDFIMTDGEEALVLLSEYEEDRPVTPQKAYSLSDIKIADAYRSSLVPDVQVASMSIPENATVYATQYPTVNFDSRANIVGQGVEGTCWAACVASKVCYESTSYSNLTADDVYNAVNDVFKSIGSKRQRYERGLSVYGFTMDSSFTGIKPFSVLQSKTQNEKNLVIMRLQNNNSDAVHAVVLKGYQIINPIEGSVYLLMDPNSSHHEAVRISESVYNGTSGFTYVSKTKSYTWFDSICTKKGN